MQDIIAAQKIQRRQKASLLSTAMKYRPLPEQPFITSQQLPRRAKKPRAPVSQAVPVPGQNPSYRGPGLWSRAAALPSALADFAGRAGLSRRPPVFWALVLGGCAAVLALSAALVSYIPEPLPPEAAVSGLSGGISRGIPGVPAGENGGDEIPLDLTEAFAWQSYTVKSGDSVEAISRRFGLSLDAVIASNNLRNVRQLRAGETLRIPNMDGIPYTVRQGDSYAKIARSMDVPLEAILDANDIQSDAISAGTVLFIPGAKMDKAALRQALGEQFVWPISGRRTSSYGWRNDPFTGIRSFHAGLDIAAPAGTPVKAAADGRVSATGYNAVYGNFIIVTHSAEYQTMYAHLSKILAVNGAAVNQGTLIGLVGNTGRSTGAHLHFSVYKNKRAINPLEVLNK